MEDPYRRELEIAVAAVRKAADRYVSDGNRESEEKANSVGSYDIVTYSDVEAQDSIVSDIRAAFPDDRFYCEESDGNSLTDDRTWVIDPIDGTLSYERGMPIYGTQLALFVKSVPVLSVIYVPVLGEMYTATEVSGAKLNGRSLGAKDVKAEGDGYRVSWQAPFEPGELRVRAIRNVAGNFVLDASVTDYVG